MCAPDGIDMLHFVLKQAQDLSHLANGNSGFLIWISSELTFQNKKKKLEAYFNCTTGQHWVAWYLLARKTSSTLQRSIQKNCLPWMSWPNSLTNSWKLMESLPFVQQQDSLSYPICIIWKETVSFCPAFCISKILNNSWECWEWYLIVTLSVVHSYCWISGWCINMTLTLTWP